MAGAAAAAGAAGAGGGGGGASWPDAALAGGACPASSTGLALAGADESSEWTETISHGSIILSGAVAALEGAALEDAASDVEP